jgi:hypothetical protein
MLRVNSFPQILLVHLRIERATRLDGIPELDEPGHARRDLLQRRRRQEPPLYHRFYHNELCRFPIRITVYISDVLE